MLHDRHMAIQRAGVLLGALLLSLILTLGGSSAYAVSSCTANCDSDCHGLGGGCSCGTPRTGCICSGGGCGAYACCGMWNGEQMCASGNCGTGYKDARLRNTFVPASWKNRCSTRSNSLFRDAVFVPDAALANIEVLTKDASALQVGITTVTYDPIPGGFKNLAYQIKNNSERRIVAIEIFIEVSDGVNVSRSPQYIDAWAKEGAGLLPFDSEPGPEGLWMVSNGGGVRSIELSIGAVVFTDGTTLGEDAADFRKFLTSEHQKLLTRAVSISKVLNSKGISAARLMIEEPAMSISERHANLLLEAALERGGPRAMQAEVARLQSLQP